MTSISDEKYFVSTKPGPVWPEPTDPPVVWAQWYGRMGWSVFPLWPVRVDGSCTCTLKGCDQPGKHPKVRWTHAATSDPDRIAWWWSDDPEAGIGVHLDGGEVSLLVIDLDSKTAVDTWFKGPFQFERTLISRTARGLHLVYRLDPGSDSLRTVPQAKVTRIHNQPDTDLKAGTGFAVLPPSRHRTGHVYRWLDTGSIYSPSDDLLRWVAECGGVNPRSGRPLAAVNLLPWLERFGGRLADRAPADLGTPSALSHEPDGAWIHHPEALTWDALDRLSSAQPGSRNTTANSSAWCLVNVVSTGWINPDEARRAYLSAARDCGIEAEAVGIWDRLARQAQPTWQRLGITDNNSISESGAAA